MNKDNAAEFLPMVQAMADGKTIQHRGNNGKWYDSDPCYFSLKVSDYRIKPEPRVPREWGMWVAPDGQLTPNSDMLTREAVRVREIIEEPTP